MSKRIRDIGVVKVINGRNQRIAEPKGRMRKTEGTEESKAGALLKQAFHAVRELFISLLN